MSVHYVDTTHGALADYAMLLSEAATVLEAIAAGPAQQRTEEFEALVEIHAEGDDLHRGIVVESHDRWLVSLSRTLQDMFGTVMRLGTQLSKGAEAPSSVRFIPQITTAVTTALDHLDDADLVVDQALVIAGAALGLDPHGPQPAPAAHPIGRLAASAAAGQAAMQAMTDRVSA